MDLKIRLFALAKELGIDSKVLIEHCNSAGIKVKNSPLASISPEERDLVLGHLKGAEPSAAGVATEESQMTPFARVEPRSGGQDPQHQAGCFPAPLGTRPGNGGHRAGTGRSRRAGRHRRRGGAGRTPPAPAAPNAPPRSRPLLPSVAATGPSRGPLMRRAGSGTEKPSDGERQPPALPPRSVRKNTFRPAAGEALRRSAK